MGADTAMKDECDAIASRSCVRVRRRVGVPRTLANVERRRAWTFLASGFLGVRKRTRAEGFLPNARLERRSVSRSS